MSPEVNVLTRSAEQKYASVYASCRVDSRIAPSQWETSLQSNAVSHWLGANLESAPHMCDLPTCWGLRHLKPNHRVAYKHFCSPTFLVPSVPKQTYFSWGVTVLSVLWIHGRHESSASKLTNYMIKIAPEIRGNYIPIPRCTLNFVLTSERTNAVVSFDIDYVDDLEQNLPSNL